MPQSLLGGFYRNTCIPQYCGMPMAEQPPGNVRQTKALCLGLDFSCHDAGVLSRTVDPIAGENPLIGRCVRTLRQKCSQVFARVRSVGVVENRELVKLGKLIKPSMLRCCLCCQFSRPCVRCTPCKQEKPDKPHKPVKLSVLHHTDTPYADEPEPVSCLQAHRFIPCLDCQYVADY